MPIPKIPADIRHYIAALDLVSIAITSRNHLVLTTDPAGHQQAWWLHRRDGNRLLEEARHRRNVELAAKKLAVRITEHSRCMARCDLALGKVDAILRNAKANGTLQKFHHAYRERREAARRRGETFIPFSTAHKRLERELTRCIAAGVRGDAFTLALTSVFDQPSP
jgi:hypothetical protein